MNQELINYIKEEMNSGVSDYQITQTLLQHSWNKEQITSHLNAARQPQGLTQSTVDPNSHQSFQQEEPRGFIAKVGHWYKKRTESSSRYLGIGIYGFLAVAGLISAGLLAGVLSTFGGGESSGIVAAIGAYLGLYTAISILTGPFSFWLATKTLAKKTAGKVTKAFNFQLY